MIFAPFPFLSHSAFIYTSVHRNRSYVNPVEISLFSSWEEPTSLHIATNSTQQSFLNTHLHHQPHQGTQRVLTLSTTIKTTTTVSQCLHTAQTTTYVVETSRTLTGSAPQNIDTNTPPFTGLRQLPQRCRPLRRSLQALPCPQERCLHERRSAARGRPPRQGRQC